MKSTSQKQPTERITRSQPNRRLVAENCAKQQPKKCSRMDVYVHEPVTISTEIHQAEIQQTANLNKMIDDLTAANKAMNVQLCSLVNNYQSIQCTIATFCEENAALKDVNTKLRNTVELLIADNAVLKEENSKLSDDIRTIFNDMDYTMGKVQQLEQKTLSNNIEISGVPAMENEDLTEVLHRLFEHADYQFSDATIKDAYRKKPNKKSGLPGVVIATFDCLANKTCFMKKIKGKQLTSEFISSSHCRPIYINDHLSRVNKYLFYLARCMRRKGDIKYVWIDNGKVLVKKAEGMESIVVECPKTLDSLRDLQIIQ